MKTLKRPLIAVAVLAASALVATSGGAGATSSASLDADVFSDAVFAGTYVSTGATNSAINGNVVAGTYLTLGATSTVSGVASSGTATTFGAAATAGSSTAGNTGNTSPGASEITAAQTALLAMAPGVGETLGNVATGASYTAGTNVKVNGLRTYTANTVINIDATNCEDFVLNATGYITFGAGVTVNHNIGSCTDNPRVFWNAGGYISIGAGADIVGTVIAKTYVSLGATASVHGSNAENAACGSGVYSQSSYVSIGAGATVSGGGDCQEEAAGCEPDIIILTDENGKEYIYNTCECELSENFSA
ncbi:MAG: hypothetical protein ACJA14_000570 [Ilumatobacter sp.]|jgi:hypothetical protein